MVRLLLVDQRVNPTVFNNECLALASSGGRLEVVQELLADKRVKIGADHRAIIWARESGHKEIVNLLTAHVLCI